MGIAASLFFSTTDKENCLDWRVRPSDEQYDSQQERWNDLIGHLKGDLAKRSGYIIRGWLQGSYKFGTQVRPANPDEEFDIDLGVYFQWSGKPDDGDYGPAELKDFVQEGLIAYVEDDGNDSNEVANPKARCNRIHFEDGFHIDVPSYHLDPAADSRSLATNDGKWEKSDPKAIYVWWKDLTENRDRPRCRRLVRCLKMWASLKFQESERPSSILLTVLVGEAMQGIDLDAHSGDDEFLREVIAAIVDRFKRSYVVSNPVDSKENLNRLSTNDCENFEIKMEEFLFVADRGLAAGTKSEAAEIWSEAFDHFFPVPKDDDEDKTVLRSESRELARIQFDPHVSVRASAKGRVFQGQNSIGPIPKGCEITFTISNALQLPAGATVHWMVRNSGADAERINDLGHRAGTGISTERDSAYRGTHSMDVSVKLNGRLIGSRRVPVKVTSLGMPLRNPPKPAWTKLRRKKS